MAKLKNLVVRTRLKNTVERAHFESDITPLYSWERGSAFDTNDYVFLPSKKEILFLPLNNRIAKVTDYALMNGGWHYIYGSNLEETRNTCYFLRSGEYDTDSRAIHIIADGSSCGTEVYDNNCCQCPAINLNLSAVLASEKIRDYLDIQPVSNYIGHIKYYTLRFGSYPQRVADNNSELERLYKSNKLTPTGKQYTGYMKNDGNFQRNPEFEYNGKKYVRVISKLCENDRGTIKYGNNTFAPDTGTPVWAEVQPIRWKIHNWDKLPKELNPNGNGTAQEITVYSEKALLAGIPFYPSKDKHLEYTMWQNSPIRAILNGYDLQNEINNGNGNKEYMIGKNFNFRGNSFLDDIEDGSLLEDKDLLMSNPYGFVYDDVDNDDLLMMYIQSGTSVFLHGPSGVGKSSRVKQIDPTATRITLRPQMNPEEIDGTLDRETGNYIAPLWYTQLCEKCKAEPDRKHVLFIDELTNVKPTVQSLVYSIVLDHAGKDGLWPLPDNAVVVAAGNETADSSVANNLPGALHRRFCHIYYQIDKQAWLDWAMGVSKVKKQKYEPSKKEAKAKIHPAILTYLMSRDDNILNQDLDEENPKIVTDPRKWEIASNVLYETKNPKALVPAIGEDLTADFTFFVQSIPVSVNDVINGEYSKRDFAEMAIDRKMSTVLGLLPAKEEHLTTVRAFIKDNLGKELLATYDSLWIRNDPERAQIIAENSLENIEENING